MVSNSVARDSSEDLRKATELVAKGEYLAARDLFTTHFDGSDVYVANQLGYIYKHKGFAERDIESSIRYFIVAAEAGDTYGMHGLGEASFEKGDLDNAIRWTTNASDAGRGHSSYTLFHYYKKLNNSELARSFLLKAAAQGDAPAKQRLAIYKLTGRFGVGKIFEGFREYFSNFSNLIEYTKNNIK